MLLAAIGYPELAPSDFEWIQTIRAQYDIANYDLIRPHFTFVFPCSRINREEFLSHIEEISAPTNSVTFNIRRATISCDKSGEKWHLFLVPDEAYNDIIGLHDKLYTGILADKLRPDIPYIPHITVGVFDNEQACIKRADELNKSAFSIWGQISSIEVISFKDNQVETIGKVDLISNSQ